MNPLTRLCASVTALAAAGVTLTACGSTDNGIVINLYNAPQQNIQTIVDRCNGLAGDDYTIKLNLLPRDADGQREQLVRRLAAGDDGMDVLGMDITWTAEFAEAGWIREWTGDNKAKAEEDTLEKPLQVARWNDKLYAAPYNTNVQLLWYRTDLVPEAPTTWDELISASEQLAANGQPAYAEVQGAQYEGLMVWFNAMVASAGGQIVSDSGDEVALGEPARRALETMKTFATSRAADPSLANTHEQEALLAMQNGSAAFQLNWPFVYAALRDAGVDFFDSLAWAPYPGLDGPGASPLGGAEFAVSTYSKNPDEAFAAALCLRDPESQKTAAILDGIPPTIASVYDEPEMADAYPMKDAIVESLQTAGPRPATPFYQNVSTTTTAIISPPRNIEPDATLRRLTDELTDALESKGVLP